MGFAVVAATVANGQRAKNQKAFKPEDFMPKFGKPRNNDDDEPDPGEFPSLADGVDDEPFED